MRGFQLEMPMYRRNVDSFPFWRILALADVLFLGEVMPNFSVDHGLTIYSLAGDHGSTRSEQTPLG